MRAVATFIFRLAKVIIAADLAGRREFRSEGMGRRHPHMSDLVDRLMHDRSTCPGQYRGAVDDSYEIAHAVYWDYFEPHVVKMLVDKWGADEKEARKVVDSYFVDDSPQYDPTPRSQRRG